MQITLNGKAVGRPLFILSGVEWPLYIAGNDSAYIAMFDEIDEGTAIFKCTNDPPVGASAFGTYEGKPSDHYLWLCSEERRLLRGEIPNRK